MVKWPMAVLLSVELNVVGGIGTLEALKLGRGLEKLPMFEVLEGDAVVMLEIVVVVVLVAA